MVASLPPPQGGAIRLQFQSPSLRGSGRFRDSAPANVGCAGFQSPSLRGSGRFTWRAARWRGSRKRVSIPFIAGQWSLLIAPLAARRGRAEEFQSPSLRGSGRFTLARPLSGRAGGVSIPFIAGQWSLPRGRGLRGNHPRTSFNPLHCGAVVASGDASYEASPAGKFQSPSLRGSGRFGKK